MKVKVSKRFVSDIKKIRSKEMAELALFFVDFCLHADKAEEIPGFKFLKGHPGYGRISIEQYRIGVHVTAASIKFLCLIHRSKIYSQFP